MKKGLIVACGFMFCVTLPSLAQSQAGDMVGAVKASSPAFHLASTDADPTIGVKICGAKTADRGHDGADDLDRSGLANYQVSQTMRAPKM